MPDKLASTSSRHVRWKPVREELLRWQDAGRVAHLWLRDDDAIAVTPALARLAELCASHEVPYLVAAIPSRAGEDLAAYLSTQRLAEVAAHGWTHHNHASEGAKKEEFPASRPRSEILRELGLARARIDALFTRNSVPIYVAPWNRIVPEVASLLPDAGFTAVSVLGRKSTFAGRPPLPEVNVHVDIIDWRGSRTGRDPGELASELALQLASAREEGHAVTGILTHHLVHDDIAWQFLEELFAETAVHPAVRWSRASSLLLRHS